MSSFTNGNKNSGGWRFGNGDFATMFSNMYSPEQYNKDLLQKVGNPFRKEAQKDATKIDLPAVQGLLGSSRDGGRDAATGQQTDYGAVIGDPSASGKTWGELTPTQQAIYSSKVDPLGIGSVIAGIVTNSPIGKIGTTFATFMDKQLGRQTPAEVEAQKTYGLSLDNFRDIVSQMSVNGQGGFMAAPAPNTGMSLSDQYSQYGAGRVAAENAVSSGLLSGYDASGNTNPTGYAADGMGPPSSAAPSVDSYSGTSGQGSGYDASASGTDSENDSRSAGGDYGWAKGGPVTKKRLVGPNPKGPDQGFGALQSGEYVIKKDAVEKYGKGLLEDINSMTFKGGK